MFSSDLILARTFFRQSRHLFFCLHHQTALNDAHFWNARRSSAVVVVLGATSMRSFCHEIRVAEHMVNKKKHIRDDMPN